MDSENVIQLDNEDAKCIRRMFHVSKNAGAVSKSSPFAALINSLIEDELLKIKAENDGMLRYAALIGSSKISFVTKETHVDYCIMCFDAPATKVLSTCRHCYCCDVCETGEQCAICRADVSKIGSVKDFDKVYMAGVESDEKYSETFVTFKNPNDKKKTYRDFITLIENEEDLAAALKNFVADADKQLPIPISDLAVDSPSLFWSLYRMSAQKTEEDLMVTQCSICDVLEAPRKRRRRG